MQCISQHAGLLAVRLLLLLLPFHFPEALMLTTTRKFITYCGC
jgi:hypothetical protein